MTAANDVSLTPTSYLVLGLVANVGPCTPYDMKRVVGISLGMFWSFPHSQLYAEPARLAAAGLLTEQQEEGGRRRRTYAITAAGTAALTGWLREPAQEVGELRDLGLLKLFFASLLDGDDIVDLARAQHRAHVDEIAKLEAIRAENDALATRAQMATLELGLRWNKTAADFWAEVAANPPA